GGGRAVRRAGELGRRASLAVHQRREHRHPCRLGEERGGAGDVEAGRRPEVFHAGNGTPPPAKMLRSATKHPWNGQTALRNSPRRGFSPLPPFPAKRGRVLLHASRRAAEPPPRQR